jgi:uncharacterized protein YhaN
MSKPDSVYKLRKRIKELEREVYLLRDDRSAFKNACERVLISVMTCKVNEAIAPMSIIEKLGPLMLRTKVY